MELPNSVSTAHTSSAYKYSPKAHFFLPHFSPHPLPSPSKPIFTITKSPPRRTEANSLSPHDLSPPPKQPLTATHRHPHHQTPTPRIKPASHAPNSPKPHRNLPLTHPNNVYPPLLPGPQTHQKTHPRHAPLEAPLPRRTRARTLSLRLRTHTHTSTRPRVTQQRHHPLSAQQPLRPPVPRARRRRRGDRRGLDPGRDESHGGAYVRRTSNPSRTSSPGLDAAADFGPRWPAPSSGCCSWCVATWCCSGLRCR